MITGGMASKRHHIRIEGERQQDRAGRAWGETRRDAPESIESESGANPSLQTLRCVRVMISDKPCALNSSLEKQTTTT
jgi:hypothetical protein